MLWPPALGLRGFTAASAAQSWTTPAPGPVEQAVITCPLPVPPSSILSKVLGCAPHGLRPSGVHCEASEVPGARPRLSRVWESSHQFSQFWGSLPSDPSSQPGALCPLEAWLLRRTNANPGSASSHNIPCPKGHLPFRETTFRIASQHTQLPEAAVSTVGPALLSAPRPSLPDGYLTLVSRTRAFLRRRI